METSPVNTILLWTTILICILFWVSTLFRTSSLARVKRILGWYVAFLGGALFTYSVLSGEYNSLWKQLAQFFYYPLNLALFPTLYVFVHRLSGGEKPSCFCKRIPHYLPTILALFMLPAMYKYIPESVWVQFVSAPANLPYPETYPAFLKLYLYVFNDSVFILQLLLYTYLMMKLLLNPPLKDKQLQAVITSKLLNFFKIYVAIFFMISLLLLIMRYFASLEPGVCQLISTIGILVLVVYLGLFLYKSPVAEVNRQSPIDNRQSPIDN